MSFQDAINRILHVVNDGNGNPKYVPYVTGSGSIPNVNASVRNDYDKIRTTGTPFHGGVDIIYYENKNGTPTWIGSGDPGNQNVSVYSPVIGQAWNQSGTGTVIILDQYGYFHIIRHMRNINSSLSTNPAAPTQITNDNINTFALGIMSNANLPTINGQRPAIHVHYEITTFYSPTVQKYQKIDPEAFWNNYPASADGFFTLTGSYKIGNQFYGTSSKEILRGEGVKDGDAQKYASFNDKDILSGGGGSDIIDGGSGDDKLFGGNAYGIGKYYKIKDGVLDKSSKVQEDADETGADTLIGGMGKDYLDSGKGNDVLYGGVATILSDNTVFYSELLDDDTSNDELHGGAGNDTLYGGGGNDKLYSGSGNDFLYGGAGDDEYYIEAGEVEARIEDKQGSNTLYICGRKITDFHWDSSTSQYESFAGDVVGVKSGTDFIVYYIGTKVILNEDFQWGDFGINLITVPDNPTTENTILGDLKLVDFDPNTEGIQGQLDQWGNEITDSSQPEAGKVDFIYDTTGNDRIKAGGGDDSVNCYEGGANWISGGDGCDFLDGDNSSSCIIEGEAGSDIVFGGINGNSQLFGDSYGDMAMLIAEGETAEDSGVKGDVVAVYWGDNYLYGSDGYDIMWGGIGKDLIVAGGGNDLILGDGGSIAAYYGDNYNWSFTIDVSGDTYTPVITGLAGFEMNAPSGDDDVIYTGTGNDFVNYWGRIFNLDN